MKRKVIKQGNNALTITLPRVWTTMHGVIAGDHISLEEDRAFPGSLILTTENKGKATKELSLDLSSFDDKAIERNPASILEGFVNNCYRYGYDKLTIFYSSPVDYLKIEKRVQQLPGFELTKKTKTSCVVEVVSEPTHAAVDFLKETFLTLMELFSLFEQKSTKTTLAYASTLRWKVVRFDNVSRRIVSKQLANDAHGGALHFVHSRTTLLAAGLDRLYQLLFYTSCKKKATKEIVSSCSQILDKLRLAYATKKISKIQKLYRESRNLLYKDLYKALESSSGKESILLYHLGDVLRNTYLLTNSLLGALMNKEA